MQFFGTDFTHKRAVSHWQCPIRRVHTHTSALLTVEEEGRSLQQGKAWPLAVFVGSATECCKALRQPERMPHGYLNGNVLKQWPIEALVEDP